MHQKLSKQAMAKYFFQESTIYECFFEDTPTDRKLLTFNHLWPLPEFSDNPREK